jgi:hypothetical protein
VSKTRPVRWWRDDATRYQSRPLFASPPTLDLEQSRYLDDIAESHARYQDARRAWWSGESVAAPRVEFIKPVEFERLEPMPPLTAAEQEELDRDLAATYASGWRPPEPVMILCTLPGASLLEPV